MDLGEQIAGWIDVGGCVLQAIAFLVVAVWRRTHPDEKVDEDEVNLQFGRPWRPNYPEVVFEDLAEAVRFEANVSDEAWWATQPGRV